MNNKRLNTLQWALEYSHMITEFGYSIDDPYRANRLVIKLTNHIKSFLSSNVNKKYRKEKLIEILNDLKFSITLANIQDKQREIVAKREEYNKYFNFSARFLKSGYDKQSINVLRKDGENGDFSKKVEFDNLVNKIRFRRDLLRVISLQNSDLVLLSREYKILWDRFAHLYKVVLDNYRQSTQKTL